MSWPIEARAAVASAVSRKRGVRRLLAQASIRAALVQALTVACALTLAGVLADTLSDRLQTNLVRERVLGEVRSMEEEYVKHGGAAHLALTADKRGRLWRGFAYRLSDPQGRTRAGFLPTSHAQAGWTKVAGRPRDPDHRLRPYLVYGEALPDGSHLSVGQDLSAQILERGVLLQSLLFSGACAIVVGGCASFAFSRRAWRGVYAIAQTARQVEAGALDPRVPLRSGPPQDDLDELAVTFNAMLDRIGALVAQVRQVSRDIAHDLRTPLTRVGQRLERLRLDNEDRPEVAGRIRQVEQDLAESLRTFDALLQLAEIEAERSHETDRAFDLGEMAARVAEAFRPDIEEGARQLSLESPCATIRGDERLVGQALANLLENAIRHTPPGSGIHVAVTPGASVSLVVQDDGPGIPSHARQSVLRPLVRLEGSRHLPGSGLGLSIVAAVATRHRADLRLEDAGPGLRIRMTFPSANIERLLDVSPASAPRHCHRVTRAFRGSSL